MDTNLPAHAERHSVAWTVVIKRLSPAQLHAAGEACSDCRLQRLSPPATSTITAVSFKIKWEMLHFRCSSRSGVN